MKKSKILFNALALFAMLPLISSCGLLQNNSMTREEAYPELYAQKPLSIVIMPPINQTNKVEAKESVYASLYKPLVERGYYVFSPMLAQELLQSESADDAELFLEGNLKPFQQVFSADAVLFTIITKWQKMSVLSTIDVGIEYILKSTRDNKVLFQRSANITVDCKVVSTSNPLLNLLANTVATGLTDNIVAARRANIFVLSDLPDGKYAPNYDKDRKTYAGFKNITGTVSR